MRWRSLAKLLEVTDLRLSRRDGWKLSLPELSLQKGEVAALHGPSGCGKTSMLLAMFGLADRAVFTATGSVRWLGEEFPSKVEAARQLYRSVLCFSMQDAHAALDPLWSIGTQLQQACGCSEAEAVVALREMGIDEAPDLVHRLPHQISGGQAQRVLLAVAFLRRPALLIADEPSASLDGGNFDELVRRLLHLREVTGTAMLLATHDHRLLQQMRAQVLVLRGSAFAPGRYERPAYPPRKPQSPSKLTLLQARGVELCHGARRIVSAADLDLHRGEVVALVGESGAGKTTLARGLAGYHPLSAGTLVRPQRRQAVQLLFQDALASMTPGRTVRSLVREVQAPFFDLDGNAAAIGLDHGELDRAAGQLSGGERRRAALLRALSVNPEVLVLDEPTASLDRAAAVSVVQALLRLQQQRALALLLVTHDLDLAAAIADRVIKLEGGRLCA